VAFTSLAPGFTFARDLASLACLTLTPQLAFARDVAFTCVSFALACRSLPFPSLPLARLSLAFTCDLVVAFGAAQALTCDLPLALRVMSVTSRFVALPVGRRRLIDVTGLRCGVAYLNRPEGCCDAYWQDELVIFD
jgi:hypothetical protein